LHKIFLLTIVPGILILLSLILTGCENDPIFYYLETEEPIVDRNLPNSIAVTDVTETQGYIYATAEKIYRRRLTGSRWSDISSPSDTEYVYAVASVDDGTLYCAAIKANTTHAVYSLAPGTSAWIEETSLPGDYYTLFSSEGYTLIGVKNNETWNLYSSEDGFNSALNCGEGKWGGAAYGGTSYYSGINDKIRKNDAALIYNFDSSTSITDLKSLSGELYTLFDDKIYKTATPDSSPQTAAVSDTAEDTLTAIGFWNDTLFAGSDGTGLYELNSGNWQLPDDDNYHITPLPTSSVRFIFTTSRGDILVSTFGEGLWCRESDSLLWSRE